jgi:hypothetical protein
MCCFLARRACATSPPSSCCVHEVYFARSAHYEEASAPCRHMAARWDASLPDWALQFLDRSTGAVSKYTVNAISKANSLVSRSWE